MKRWKIGNDKQSEWIMGVKKKRKILYIIKEFWRLESGDWKKYNKEQIIFEGNVLKWI